MRKVFFSFILIFLLVLIAQLSANVPPSTTDNEKQEIAGQQTDSKCWFTGRVVWQGHDLKKASVQVFKDQKMKDLYTEGFLHDPEGTYALEIDDPGTYYMVAFVDDNSNNKFDAGDGMGMYGIVDWADSNQQPESITLTKGMKLLGMDIVITAVVNEQGSLIPLPSSNSADITTGISGKLFFTDQKFTNAIVFVYTDPLWNNRIAQAKVSENGEYAVSVPAGKYYVLAVIDKNNSDLLDAGDRFGVWGMTRFGAIPKPVEVKEGNVRINRNILIIGKINDSGKPVPIQSTDSEPEKTTQQNVIISGKVLWPDHDLKNALIQVYDDPSMTSAVAKAKVENDGSFRLSIPEGEYYVTAGIDSDGNGKYTKGDGIGIYGAEDPTNQTPKKIIVKKDSQSEGINILITAEFDSSGQLIPITYDKQPEAEKKNENGDSPITGIRGKIIWSDHKLSNVVLVFSKDSSFKDGFRVPLKLDNDGVYTCSTDPGIHYIMAIVDTDSNEQTDAGDGIGFYGTGYLGEGHWGEPQSVTVLESRVTTYVNIKITAVMGDDGKPSATPDGVRSYYGDPNDVFDTDQNTQEWWYWTRGIAFTFKKIDEVWKLVDVYQFTPKDISSAKSSENTNGVIYYTIDGYIWAVNEDGSNRRRVASGIRVTGTFEGDKLLFLDGYSGIEIFTPNNQTLTDLNWSQEGSQPSLSNDGKSVAFTVNLNGHRQINIRNIETGNEITIPGANMDMSNPSWSPDGELLAYTASLPVLSDQQKRNSDIYYYDLVAKRTERISANPQDEFDPAWGPGETRVLVFCRSEGDHSQLWIASFDANGKPSERQITKYGGHNPAWSPEGDRIIYENNAQLWTVKPDGKDESPILVNDEPVFGLDPFWTR